MRRRNPFAVLIVPLILACILAVLIIMDKRSSSAHTENSEGIGDTTVSCTVTPVPDPILTPTEVPTNNPTPTPEPTSTPSPTPTPTKAAASPTPVPSADVSNPTENPKEDTGETEASLSKISYTSLFEQQGGNYTLVADSVSKHFIVINDQNQTIRQTEFTYNPTYDDWQGNGYEPIFGYKNGYFIFFAQNQIVSSDGKTESILSTMDDENINIRILLQSDNRILAGIGKNLVVIDCRTLAVETYTEDYSEEFIIFTDEYLSFSSIGRIPAGPYYHYLYTAKDGHVERIASIGEMDEYVLDKDTVIIKSNEDLFQINLKTNTLTSPCEISRERKLYFPVYGDGIISGLSEIRYINYNHSEKPVQSITLPDFLEAECYYNSYYDISVFSFLMKDPSKAAQFPKNIFGSFKTVDYSIFPLQDEKFLSNSVVKENLYSGMTVVGEGEIFLLEKIEIENNESIPLEIIYAWIPIEGETKAYQLYVYVPPGESNISYFKMIKQFLQAE